MLSESSFDDVELSTILTVMDQDELNINSELELFSALTRYAEKHNHSSGAKVPRLEGIGNCALFFTLIQPGFRDSLEFNKSPHLKLNHAIQLDKNFQQAVHRSKTQRRIDQRSATR